MTCLVPGQPPAVPQRPHVPDPHLLDDAGRDRRPGDIRAALLPHRVRDPVPAVPVPRLRDPGRVHDHHAHPVDEPADRFGRRRHRVRPAQRAAQAPRHAGGAAHGAGAQAAPLPARQGRQDGAQGVP